MVQKNNSICDQKKCTGCGACINICPINSISLVHNEFMEKHATINSEKCIDCGLCRKVCPQLVYNIGERSKKCYAAWSVDELVRKKSASGGIATELYKKIILEGGFIAGVSMNDDYEGEFCLTNNISDIQLFQNSKYVFSDTKDVFQRILKCLKQDFPVLFVGLPCQIAGLKQFLINKKCSDTKLITVDLVCHGTTPSAYLKEHVRYVEKKKRIGVNNISFREPSENTSSFTLSLKDNDIIKYKKKVHRNDMYQIGYHYGISYRENCYECIYARPERQGDITLADFAYVGSYMPFQYSKENVSCVLINTEKGKKVFEGIVDDGRVKAFERPIEEETNNEKQLQSPTVRSKYQKCFRSNYSKFNSFERAMKKSVQLIVLKNEFTYYLRLNELRNSISRVVPKKIKDVIRRGICH